MGLTAPADLIEVVLQGARLIPGLGAHASTPGAMR